MRLANRSAWFVTARTASGGAIVALQVCTLRHALARASCRFRVHRFHFDRLRDQRAAFKAEAE